ncbi:MAG: LCP family protein, partial [Nocardioidaceae bacterium]|nr:LCP family protein [Nocardioidaceae bacterium]
MSSDDQSSRGDGADHGDGSMFDYDDTGKRKAGKSRGVVRRHPVIVSLLLLLTLVVGAAFTLLLYLNNQIGNIARVPIAEGLNPDDRPVEIDNESMNILLAGVDKGDGRSVAELVETGWEPGVFRSDTIMILHVTADRDDAYLVSIPRDSYVALYDESGNFEYKDKVNAALSVFGPSAYVSTIEHLTGLRMDHLAAVDWEGFKDISTALGGVEVYIPETFYDTSQRRWWYEGTKILEGDDALSYVRTRYNLPDDSGDFGRIARQQNFMRAMVGKMLSQGTLANPLKLTNTVEAVVKNLTVDEEFESGEIRDLALSLRGLRTEDLTFLTAPWSGYGNQSGSTVILDQAQGNALWRAMA